MTLSDAKQIIRLEHVTAGYDGREQISDVSLTVGRRDFIVVTGPNGSGKTTLMRVIMGLIEPMRGTVTYGCGGNTDSDTYQKPATRPRFGYLPQYSAIDRDFPINVYDTVLSGLSGTKGIFSRITTDDRQAVRQALERVGMTDAGRLPIRRLSGGQLQRVLLARAIAARPDVLMLDEPTTYIDKQSWQRIGNIIGELRDNCAIVMVSHDAGFIDSLSPTRILRMESGAIIC